MKAHAYSYSNWNGKLSLWLYCTTTYRPTAQIDIRINAIYTMGDLVARAVDSIYLSTRWNTRAPWSINAIAERYQLFYLKYLSTPEDETLTIAVAIESYELYLKFVWNQHFGLFRVVLRAKFKNLQTPSNTNFSPKWWNSTMNERYFLSINHCLILFSIFTKIIIEVFL